MEVQQCVSFVLLALEMLQLLQALPWKYNDCCATYVAANNMKHAQVFV